MDVTRQQAVWNRVTAPISGGQSREELRILLMNAGELLRLIQGLPSKAARSREKCRQIQQWEQANVDCLKGMLVFSGQDGAIPLRTPSPAPAKQSLVRGYYLAKKGAAEYTARSVDPEFGVVYQEMAQREMKICNFIVQLMGEL